MRSRHRSCAAPSPSSSRAETPAEVVLSRHLLGVTYCMVLWDGTSEIRLLERAADAARAVGALRDLDSILFCLSMSETTLGRLAAADRVPRRRPPRCGPRSERRRTCGSAYRHPELLAWHATAEHLDETIQRAADGAAYLGMGAVVSIAQVAAWTILELGRADYAETCALARGLVEGDRLGVHSRVLPDLVEAAARVRRARGRRRRGSDTLRARAEASGTPWALGLLSRSEALLAPDDEAEAHYQRALDLLPSAGAVADVGRAHLLYGEWLRRQKRRTDAREQLDAAHAIFVDMGAMAFAERARVELAATGGRARRRSAETTNDLTPQEHQIALLAARGTPTPRSWPASTSAPVPSTTT